MMVPASPPDTTAPTASDSTVQSDCLEAPVFFETYTRPGSVLLIACVGIDCLIQGAWCREMQRLALMLLLAAVEWRELWKLDC